ncbi:MAG: hypothetical protein ACTSXL_03890 [Alphaproteobacteria bacterium]
MAKQYYTQTSFSRGMVSLPIFVRSDLQAQSNGLMSLENAFITPTGGIKRREGTQFIDTLSGKSRLISFGTPNGEVLIILINLKLYIYENEILTYEHATDWAESDLGRIQWTQSLDTLFLVHPDFEPKQLLKNTDVWQLKNWEFEENDNGQKLDPFYKFEDTKGVVLTPLGTTGTFQINTSSNYFSTENIGGKIRLNNGEIEITDIIDTDTIEVQSIKDLENTNANNDWSEQCFSDFRGFPISVSFYQNRLIIGGAKSLPHKVWMSKTGEVFNFDFGEGLDDEAITFTLLSDRREHIATVFSGRHLQILTAESEWMIQGEPLTPATIKIKKQTAIGTDETHYIPPQNVEGSTIFVAQNGKEIREFIFGEVDQSYQSYDLALLSGHLMKTPIDQVYNDENRQLFVVMENGEIAVLVHHKSVDITAWSIYKTQGNFQSIAVVGGETFVAVERANGVFLEKFNSELQLDCAIENENTNEVSLPHLNNQSVAWVGDNFESNLENLIEDDTLSLPSEMEKVSVGLSFSHLIEPLPILTLTGAVAKKWRLIELRLNLKDSHFLEAEVKGEKHSVQLDEENYTGSYRFKSLGYVENLTIPLWKIESEHPYYFELLGFTAFVKTV